MRALKSYQACTALVCALSLVGIPAEALAAPADEASDGEAAPADAEAEAPADGEAAGESEVGPGEQASDS